MRKPKPKKKVKIFAKGRVLPQLHRDSTSTRPTPLVPSSNDSLQPTSPVASSPVFNPITHTPTVHNSSDHNTHLLTTSAPVVEAQGEETLDITPHIAYKRRSFPRVQPQERHQAKPCLSRTPQPPPPQAVAAPSPAKPAASRPRSPSRRNRAPSRRLLDSISRSDCSPNLDPDLLLQKAKLKLLSVPDPRHSQLGVHNRASSRSRHSQLAIQVSRKGSSLRPDKEPARVRVQLGVHLTLVLGGVGAKISNTKLFAIHILTMNRRSQAWPAHGSSHIASCSQQSQPTFASQPARNSNQPLAKAAARELDKKKTRPDRVRLPQHTSVTRRKTVPESSRPVPACDPIRSQLTSVCN
ncbi:hypothetical protein DY000_02044495 [Brassica cretica]|uniref:Uncharacterized protein n=1 Tax=Brassica cretica TaxID=69181 RepID=A0ABQ7F975_BRACR|nr:hypothetical protein DY000_02044495 [Brassica cretica]